MLSKNIYPTATLCDILQYMAFSVPVRIPASDRRHHRLRGLPSSGAHVHQVHQCHRGKDEQVGLFLLN